MVVGPRSGSIDKVSPTVAVASYSFWNSHKADDAGVHIDRCDWVGYQPENQNYLRVRLRVFLRVRGGDGFGITKLAYHPITRGRILPGDQNLYCETRSVRRLGRVSSRTTNATVRCQCVAGVYRPPFTRIRKRFEESV